MRPIKFRGKHQFSDIWIYGFFIKDELVDYIDNGRGVKFAISPKTIGQFTGLLDKNGKEIYEGDIIISSFSPNKVEVVEINNISHFDGNFSHIQGIGFVTELDIDNLEVIGNIYENVEGRNG